MRRSIFLAVLTLCTLSWSDGSACTNFLITKGASKSGSCMISYNADSPTLYGELYHSAERDWPVTSWLDIIEWDTGHHLGRIPQARHTYNTVGNMNRFQLSITETTFGGLEELEGQEDAIMDYGSLIYITLQRAKSAREAIAIMSELVSEYGYMSEGESFSICDPNEVWIMEMVSKGSGELGAVWVARMVPDGYVSAHANQARITQFPQSGPTALPASEIERISDTTITTVYSDDVVSFAKRKGFFPEDAPDEDFSFSDTYAPVDFGACRACEIRVWSFFNAIATGMEQYWGYAKGTDIERGKYGYATNRMPLWIKPDEKLDVRDVMDLMRDHLEGTELDMTKDVGAGPFECPYRWRPMSYFVDSVEYMNERATATQQTGFTMIAESRNWLPDEIGGILWFGVDDAASSVYFPMYSSSLRLPETWHGGSINEFDDTKAFWVFNQLTNFAYLRYNIIHPDIRARQIELEEEYLKEVAEIDAEALKIYNKKGSKKCVEFLTDYSCKTGDNLTAEWKKLYGTLFVKYMDGLTRIVSEEEAMPDVEYNPAPDWYYRTIVEDMGDKQRAE